MSQVHIPPAPVPTHQADATLAQAAPVQNTWYTILDTTSNARIYYIYVNVATTGETIEVRLTIDGVVYSGGAVAQAAGTKYCWYKDEATAVMWGATGIILAAYYTFMEGRSVKIEVRKTSAAGAGTLNGRVTYAKW